MSTSREQVEWADEIERVVARLISNHPDKAEQARNNPELQGWFVGRAMKAMSGATPYVAIVLAVRAALRSAAQPQPDDVADPYRRVQDERRDWLPDDLPAQPQPDASAGREERLGRIVTTERYGAAVKEATDRQRAATKGWPCPADKLASARDEALPSEAGKAAVPYYQRTLNSFADAVITKVSPGRDYRNKSTGLWYATIDIGPESYVSDPDFSTCASTMGEAIRACAAKIRDDAKGIGKYAPHSLLVPGYDLNHRLMKHWAEKEAALTTDRPSARDEALPSEEAAKVEALALAERAGIDMLDDHDLFVDDLTQTLLRFARLKGSASAAGREEG